jgi:Delta7-sterol 5-desaturase
VTNLKKLLFFIPSSSEPVFWFLTFILLFILITGRYLFISGLFYVIFYIWSPEKWRTRKLSNKNYKSKQLQTEIAWSTLSSLIFAAAALGTMWLWEKGYTKVYSTITTNDIWYMPLSLLISMFIQETYYYWTHRLMHHPAIFRHVHKVHHDSHTTSPFTAFSFHPIESLIQAVVLPVIVIVLPMHWIVILVQLVLMSITSVINHLNIDAFPDSRLKQQLQKWIIGASHHARHHNQYKYNFGLYFTIWDRLLNTESAVVSSTKVKPLALKLQLEQKQANAHDHRNNTATKAHANTTQETASPRQ